MKNEHNILLLVINNLEGLYEGNLQYYFKLIFNSPNIFRPYHNFRHMMHVLCSAYIGGKFMNYHKLFGKRAFRALLIAAMFHDYAHSGVMGNDKAEVARAIRTMKKHLLKEDLDLVSEITNLIKATQFPHINCEPSLGVDLIRDCDMSQVLSEVWIQQVIFGLAQEMKLTPLEILERQIDFVSAIKFKTAWAKKTFGPYIKSRVNETEQLLTIVR